jgi:hypothetical protein
MKIPEKFILLKDIKCDSKDQLVPGLLEIDSKRGSVFQYNGTSPPYLLYDDTSKDVVIVEENFDEYRIGISVEERVKVFRFLVTNKYIHILSWIPVDPKEIKPVV